jgi:hypothetical protein
MREIIKARATCSSFLLSAKTQNMKARFGIVNGLEASSNTTSAKPHEFFDHTSALHVMLASRFSATVDQKHRLRGWRSTEIHGYPRRVSTVSIIQV